MAGLVKPWDNDGSLSVTYNGEGDGEAVFSSSENTGAERTMEVSFVDASRNVIVVRTVHQAAGSVEPPTTETYTRLTCIECNGQQYINTGYVVQEDDVIDMYYISTSASSADKALFGVAESGNGIWTTLYSNTAYIRFGSASSVSISNARMRYKLSLRKGKMDIDGSTASPVFTTLPTIPLYIFASNNNNSSANMYGYCRSMGFKITKTSGDIVMDLKPCKRDSDGAIGMIDLVSGQFYANEGSGEDFIAGGEARMGEGYEAIPYITFKEDKLYDLGIVNNTYTIEVMFARSEKSTTPYLYGCVTSPHTATVSAYLSSSGSWRFGSSYKGLSTNNTFINRVIISNGSTNFNFTAGTFTKSTFTTPDTVVLGGYRAASGSLTKNYQGKVYYIRITKSSEPIIDYFPCKRLSDGGEGFWDCVTQTFIEPI